MTRAWAGRKLRTARTHQGACMGGIASDRAGSAYPSLDGPTPVSWSTGLQRTVTASGRLSEFKRPNDGFSASNLAS
jgi:hypothetical protein